MTPTPQTGQRKWFLIIVTSIFYKGETHNIDSLDDVEMMNYRWRCVVFTDDGGDGQGDGDDDLEEVEADLKLRDKFVFCWLVALMLNISFGMLEGMLICFVILLGLN